MASNHEFTLIPPNMVPSFSQQRSTSGQGVSSGSKKGLIEFRVLLPDSTLYCFGLKAHCTGQDCIDQVGAIQNLSVIINGNSKLMCKVIEGDMHYWGVEPPLLASQICISHSSV